MESHLKSGLCLDIPVPQCLQKLLSEPPLCLPIAGDTEALDLLKNFGEFFYRDKNEITQACNLASGPSDIVIILERPNGSHDYQAPFGQFVNDSPTLRAVDDLIRLATKGARSIHTVTVLDAFPYKALGNTAIPDEQCHELLGKILRAKKPKVVLCCYSGSYRHPWMQRFQTLQMPAVYYRMERSEVLIESDYTWTTIAIQSFHPSVAVNKFDRWPEYRALLMHHFAAAFAELDGGSPHQVPECVEEIRRLCALKRDGASIHETWEAATHITQLLERSYRGKHGSHLLMPPEDSDAECLRKEAYIMHDMYHFLHALSGTSRTFGALGIARALFLWRKFFRENPVYEQVGLMMLERASQQECWLRATDQDSFNVNEVQLRGPVKSSAHLGTVYDLNLQARQLIAPALSTFGAGKVRLRLDDANMYHEVANIVESHNQHINDVLKLSSTYGLTQALNINELVVQCECLVRIIRLGRYMDEEAPDLRRTDLANLYTFLHEVMTALGR